MKFLLPTGIGDSVWALHKVQSVRDKLDPYGPIDISLVGSRDKVDSRALDFVRRFRFVNSVDMQPFSIQAYGPRVHPDGTYNYILDGDYTFNDEHYIVLIPNRALEQGLRLEDWLPHYQIRWDIFKDFQIEVVERIHAADVHVQIGDYCVFYPGPLAGNTVEGHNRGPIWTPQEWVELGRRIHDEFGLHILVVGASYDHPYWEQVLSPLVKGKDYWTSVIGMTNLGELWALTDLSKFVVSYQAGVGIISTYRETPTAIFWRPHGNSISSSHYLTFDERMASAWVPPKVLDSGTHLPLIYGRSSVDSIMSEVRQRRWHESPAHSAASTAR
jgi:hypothetical protein